MKHSLTLLVLLWCGVASAAMWITPDLSIANVLSNANFKAVDGDTVTLPAGVVDWTGTQVIFTNSIILQGAGTNQTILKTGTAFGIAVAPHSSVVPYVQDLNIDGKATTIAPFFMQGHVSVGSPRGSAIVVQRCVFTNGASSSSFMVWASDCVGGVISRCLFTNYNGGVQVNNPSWGNNSDGFGDGSWADDDYFGTTNFLFIETCTFNRSPGQVGAVDSLSGARWVLRHCSINGDIIDGHGTDSGQRKRSTRAVEIYQNLLSSGGVNFQNEARGGTYRIWVNYCTNYPSIMTFKYFRDMAHCPAGGPWTPFGPADGTGAFDSNFTGIVQTGLDQTGRGKGVLLVGGSDVVAPAPVGWPLQVADISCCWSNFNNGIANPAGQCASIVLAEGRDYTNASPSTLGISYTPYTYPNPLVSSPLRIARITTLRAGKTVVGP